MVFSHQDQAFMQVALELAKKGQFTTTPNPAVGCVVVKNGEIIGRGFHQKAGEAHAEVMALREAGENAQGATAYVTLEPCSHYGRTPPCALGLINAGVSKVVAAMQDPNPQVAGNGLKMLSEAGIETAFGLLQDQAEQLNQGFFTRMRTGRPFVRLKLGASLDGRTALANGESQWITSVQSRQDVQVERAKASAILSTSATVLADNPSLNVRWNELPESTKLVYPASNLRQPIRIILDRQHQVQPSHRLFQTHSHVWLISEKARNMADFPDFCQHIQIEKTASFLTAVLDELGKRQINSLWVESGATLAGAFVEQHLVDELVVYLAPKLLGEQARGLCKFSPLQRLADAPEFLLNGVQQIENDVKLVYTRK
ncbi:MAG: bifunctional diaminohydroxyphosphoribosylaminopyrimidine deaminase/5-amino-6-(5-phosphoribosylamino)uracil reductase RibD [Pasteurellaceae bacterium]|nr:bifunctional diaminohydroxyphosphoribosylaminopyrimidine deaminase/5-amino-6-(5-phosphoribosylamino)uracil reductase RibD [Pasteurellaceae bacterium]